MTADTYPIRHYESQKKKLKIKPPKWDWKTKIVLFFIVMGGLLFWFMKTAN